MNMDNFPDQIVVTFNQLQDSQRALKKKFFTKVVSSSFLGGEELNLEAIAVNCTIPVKNCNYPDDSPAQKYLPVYADVQRAEKYKMEKLNQKKD